MDNYLCRDCGQSCVEPHVVAQCLGCGTRNEPDKLIPEDIHALRLSERGRAAARTGSLEDIYALLDNLNYVRTPYFESLVDWLHGLCRRYNEELFSLLGIRLKNIETLTDRLGRHRTAELIDAFAVRLRESIRLTDLTTRSSKRNLWILLPKTGAVGRDILKSRIVELKAHTRQAEDVALDFDIAAYTAPDDMLPDEPARLTMARIMGGSA
jgi:GGDEF domain-containing protein